MCVPNIPCVLDIFFPYQLFGDSFCTQEYISSWEIGGQNQIIFLLIVCYMCLSYSEHLPLSGAYENTLLPY